MTVSMENFFKEAWLMEFKASYNKYKETIGDLCTRLDSLLGKDFRFYEDIEEGQLRLTANWMKSPEDRGPYGESYMKMELDGTFSIIHDFHDVHYDNTKSTNLDFYDAVRLFVARISDNYEGNDRIKAQDFLMGAIDKATIEGRKVILQERAPQAA